MATFKVQTGLRLDEDIWKKISFIAKKNKRSLNSQIEFLIQEHIDEYEKINGPVPLSESPAD